MPIKDKTPGIYIIEKDAFPNSVVAVETAIPAFIGYTEKAECNGKSLLNKPTRITSFAEYVMYFGEGFKAKFFLNEQVIKDDVVSNTANFDNEDKTVRKVTTFPIGTKQMYVEIKPKHTLLLYNSIRLFFSNGGAACFILSVDTYYDKSDGIEVCADDFLGSENKPSPLEILKKESEPTLIVIPDAITLNETCYSIYLST